MQRDLMIRPGNQEDLKDIYRLVRELAIYEKAEQEVSTDPEIYKTAFEDGIFKCLVAQKGDSVIGMMLFYDAFSTWKGKMLWLEDFVVEEKFRQSGVGKMLFDSLIEYGKSNGYALIKWEVLDWNTPAIKFYEKMGAKMETNWWDGKYFLNNR